MIDPIQRFMDSQGRLRLFPARRKLKIRCLVYLAAKFEAGRVYTEREVNELLTRWHTFGDPATLRRELYDFRFLDRSADGRSYALAPVQPRPEDLIS